MESREKRYSQQMSSSANTTEHLQEKPYRLVVHDYKRNYQVWIPLSQQEAKRLESYLAHGQWIVFGVMPIEKLASGLLQPTIQLLSSEMIARSRTLSEISD